MSDKTGKASSATIEAITAVLDSGDYYPFVQPQNKWHDKNAGPMRAFAWPLLIQAGGLVQLSGSKLQLTRAGRKALAEPAVQTVKTLWKKWTDTTLFDELSRIECVKGQTGKGKHGLTAISSRREAISKALTKCPVERWISTAELLRFLSASESDFAVSRNPWNLYICDFQGSDMWGRLMHMKVLYCEKFARGSKSLNTLAAKARPARESKKKRPTAILEVRVFILASQSFVLYSPSFLLIWTKVRQLRFHRDAQRTLHGTAIIRNGLGPIGVGD